ADVDGEVGGSVGRKPLPIQRERLGFTSEQGTIHLARAADPGGEGGEGRVEPDGQAALHQLGVGRHRDRTPTGRDHRIRQGGRRLERLPFQLAKLGLSSLQEDLANAQAGGALDLAVEVDEGDFEAARQDLPHGGLAGAHESDQEDLQPALSRRPGSEDAAASATAARSRAAFRFTSPRQIAPRTATASAPAASTPARLSGAIPPIATRGFAVARRAAATNSRPTAGSGRALPVVGKTGPTATRSTSGSAAAARTCRAVWVERPIQSPAPARPATTRAAPGGRSACPRWRPATGRSAAKSARSSIQSFTPLPSSRRPVSSTSR